MLKIENDFGSGYIQSLFSYLPFLNSDELISINKVLQSMQYGGIDMLELETIDRLSKQDAFKVARFVCYVSKLSVVLMHRDSTSLFTPKSA